MVTQGISLGFGAWQLIGFFAHAFLILIKKVVHPLDIKLLDLKLLFGLDLFSLILSVIYDTIFHKHFLRKLLRMIAFMQCIKV